MISALEIAQLLSGRLYGDPSYRIDIVRPLQSKTRGGLAVVFSKKDLDSLSSTTADLLIGPDIILQSPVKNKIVVNFLSAKNINKLLTYYKVQKYHLFEQANTSSFPDVYIGKYCNIGDNCHFMPGVKIMNHVTIGKNVAIHANTVIKEGTIIGDNVTIDSNNSIGNFSFEYMSDDDDTFIRVESVGRVIIQDNVEIGCNNTIDRGTFGDTVIGYGTKIDNQVQIGHDCHIGQHCLIVSQCGFSGHTILGDYVITHGQVGTAGHITIGHHSVIKAKSGVSHSFPPYSDLFGYPAKDAKSYFRNLAVLNKITRLNAAFSLSRQKE